MPDKQNLQPLLDVRQNQLSEVFSDSDGIDAKALGILGANIAIIIFVDQTAAHLAVWELLALYLPFAASLVMDIFSVWPRKYLGMSVSLEQYPEYLSLAEDDLVLQLLTDTEAAIAHNERLNRGRMRSCIVSLTLTGLGFLTLLAIL